MNETALLVTLLAVVAIIVVVMVVLLILRQRRRRQLETAREEYGQESQRLAEERGSGKRTSSRCAGRSRSIAWSTSV